MFFFFNDTATTEIYTLSLHDALPILPFRKVRLRGLAAVSASVDGGPRGERQRRLGRGSEGWRGPRGVPPTSLRRAPDRKSTRLNSSHANISYAVFCLKKKKNKKLTIL